MGLYKSLLDRVWVSAESGGWGSLVDLGGWGHWANSAIATDWKWVLRQTELNMEHRPADQAGHPYDLKFNLIVGRICDR